MRRVLAATVLAVAALGTAHATARPPMPCDYWQHGCDVTAYVYDACRSQGVDCGIVTTG